MSLFSLTAVPKATACDEPFDFVALPLEVKELIYKHAMFAGGHLGDGLLVSTDKFGDTELQSSFPAICFTNKLERIIASRLYLRYQTITMYDCDDSPVLGAFLSQFGKANEGLSGLKNVCFAYYGKSLYGFQFRKAVDLIKICTGLKTIEFIIYSEDLYEWDEREQIESRPSTGTEIFKYLHLHGLADCGHLTEVRFSVYDESHRAELKGLKELIQDFSCEFLALHGLIASKKLDVGIHNLR